MGKIQLRIKKEMSWYLKHMHKYLYQFDLAFYDMICQYQGKDLFEKCNQIKEPIYELETIEDYSKYYEENNMNYLY